MIKINLLYIYAKNLLQTTVYRGTTTLTRWSRDPISPIVRLPGLRTTS